MLKKYTFDGSRKLDLSSMNTGSKEDKVIKEEIVQKTTVNQLAIQALQDKLYADQKEGLIILIQARDAAGKDSTIKHVMSGINPQGVDVYSFKQPTSDELAHDFLWRVNRHIPRRGKIAIYNRSYYEDVLVVQVRNLHQTYMMPKWIVEDPKFFQKRYKQIRHYEKYLHQNGYRIVKIFLNVSKKTQKERFLERIEDPDKNWKFSQSDVKERKLWDQYTQAYEDAINATASKSAPWYVIPADKKWYTRYLVSEIVRKAMEAMDPQYPVMPPEQKDLLAQYKEELESEDDGRDQKAKAKKGKEGRKAVPVPSGQDKDLQPVKTGTGSQAGKADAGKPEEKQTEPAAAKATGKQGQDKTAAKSKAESVPASHVPQVQLTSQPPAAPEVTAPGKGPRATAADTSRSGKPAAAGRKHHSRHRRHKGHGFGSSPKIAAQDEDGAKKAGHLLKNHHRSRKNQGKSPEKKQS